MGHFDDKTVGRLGLPAPIRVKSKAIETTKLKKKSSRQAKYQKLSIRALTHIQGMIHKSGRTERNVQISLRLVKAVAKGSAELS